MVRLLICIVLSGLSCLMLATEKPLQAQGLRVIANDPVQGPICAGHLGPGPCAQVQQYIATHLMAGQTFHALPLQGPAGNPGAVPPVPLGVGNVQLNGTARQIAINCAQRSGTDVRGFVACAQGNLILPQREQAVLDCAVSSRTEREFAVCAAPNLGISLTKDQRVLADCAMQSDGDEEDFVSCAGSGLVASRLSPDQKAVLNCAANANGDVSDFASCSASRIIGPRLTREQRIAVECAAQSNGDTTSFATCAGTKFLNLNLNPEQQIAVQCVVQTGGQPYAAGGCMVTRLTARELEKCAQHGFGGERGCFGDNNDLFGRNGWTARTFGQIAGGPNSVVRNPGQIFGGPNSVFNNPGQLTGGANSVVNNPGQIFGGPNSVFNNPGQITGGRNSVVNNPGQILGGPNSVFNNPGQLIPKF
jgi:hypothetical protein